MTAYNRALERCKLHSNQVIKPSSSSHTEGRETLQGTSASQHIHSLLIRTYRELDMLQQRQMQTYASDHMHALACLYTTCVSVPKLL